MPYAIMRCKKLASMGSVAGALKHCYRERETPNADPERTPGNVHTAAATTDEAMGRLRSLLPEKRRKDAVLAVEYLMTASPEWWDKADAKQQAEFFRQSRQWLADKYGEDRIVTATIHRDEKTPHLSAFVVPLTKDGRLSAKEFVGGRQKMRDDQTAYAKRLEPLGLERGIEGSKARHQTIRAYYAGIQQRVANVRLSERDVEPRVLRKGWFSRDVESPEQVAQRLTDLVQREYAPALNQASELYQQQRSAENAKRTAESLRWQKKRLERDLSDLRGTVAPALELAEVDGGAFKELMGAAAKRKQQIIEDRKREDAALMRQIERDQRMETMRTFDKLAAQRKHRFHGFKDGSEEWEATPAALRKVIDDFNRTGNKQQNAFLALIAKDKDTAQKVAGLMEQRKERVQQIDRDSGLSL